MSAVDRGAPHYGISLLRVNPRLWFDVAEEAEQLGFESVWISDHLMLPAHVDTDRYPDGKLPIRPGTPIFDVWVYLAALSARTSRIRLGTFVYLLALRHPFVSARAIGTLDVVSDGRVELGVGVGWSELEWDAAGLDFSTRGRRLDEAIEVCRGLWTQEEFAFSGECFDFPAMAFEPKPRQKPTPPFLIGGESPAALRRAARVGDGWIGMHHTPESAGEALRRVRSAESAAGREHPLSTTVGATPGDVDGDAWARSGIDRVIVAPWERSGDALAGMRRFARRHLR